jgi:hypothetical protein
MYLWSLIDNKHCVVVLNILCDIYFCNKQRLGH